MTRSTSHLPRALGSIPGSSRRRRKSTRFAVAIVVLLFASVLSSAPVAAQGPSNLVVAAKGDVGSEVLEVEVGGELVGSVTVSQDWVEYSFDVPVGMSIDQLRIAFVNDLYEPPVDRNLHVDWVELSGVRFETEAAETFSVGSWRAEDGCEAGLKQSQTLHCNGYFQYGSTVSGAADLSVLAKGDVGSEVLEVEVGGELVGSVTVSQDWVEYSFDVPVGMSIDQLRIAFVNDLYEPPVDRNLHVDWVELSGVRFETEAAETFSVGSWRAEDGCEAGLKQSQTLHCNGYFEYADGGLNCESTPALSIESHGDGQTIDTSEAGNGTGSFILAGVAPIGTSEIQVQFDEEMGAATLEQGECFVGWEIEALAPVTRSSLFVVTATDGSLTEESVSIEVDVVAPSEEDTLIAPAFAMTPQHVDSLVAFDAEQGRLAFAGDHTEDFQIGAGLVSEPVELAPYGYLLIIEEVEFDGVNTVVIARQAGLTEYIRQLDISVSFDSADVEPWRFTTQDEVAEDEIAEDSLEEAPGVPALLSNERSPGLRGLEVADGLDFTADFSVDPGFDIDIDIDFGRDGCTWCLPTVIVNRLFFEARVDLGAEAEFTYTLEDFVKIEERPFGPRFDGTLGTIIIPLPVGAITINLEAEGQAFYDVSINLAAKVSYEMTLELTMGYEFKGDGTGQGAYRNASFDGGMDDLDLKAGIAASLAVGIELDLEALLWGAAGFEIEATPKIEIAAVADLVDQQIPWEIKLVLPINGNLEIEIDLGPIDYDKEFGDVNFAELSFVLFDGVFFGDDEPDEDPDEEQPDDDEPAEDVVGENVDVIDSLITGSDEQWGRVEGFVPGESTWVLSTGRIADVVGEPADFASTALGLPGDGALSEFAGFETRDAVAYTTTVVPELGTLNVRFAFASEEYPEYVGSTFNDVMAVFVDGVNCAFVPGTSIPVSINTVNQQSFSEFYVDNTNGAAGFATSMDGLTTPITCSVPVVPGEPVTVKIAVADASDASYDSAVALLDGGIWSS